MEEERIRFRNRQTSHPLDSLGECKVKRVTYSEASADIIDRARHDRSAFGEIYDLYAHRVYAFCLAHGRDQQEAEDLVSHTFERALGAIARYQDRGVPLSAWLLQIAANLARDRGRQAGRIVYLGDNPVPEERWDRYSEPKPEEWVEQWEVAGWLSAHLAGLPVDQQRALRLRYWDGHALREIAEQMGRNENATKQLLHRALRNLRTRLGNEVSSDV